jgi:integrase
VVLSRDEVDRLINRLEGTHALMARMLYGTGMRLMECLRLRIKDMDFDNRENIIRDGKGGKDWITMLPNTLVSPMRDHLRRVRTLFETDRRKNIPGVYLPDALSSKYPNAGKEWGWQWVFPARELAVDPRSASGAAITLMSRHCNGPSSMPYARRKLSSPPLRTPSATALPLT